MGRPLKKRLFGNFNTPPIGGEGVLSVAIGTPGSGYAQNLTATVSAPEEPGGSTATIGVGVYSGNGAVSGYTVTLAGSGYLVAPTVSLVKAANVTTSVTGTISSNVLTMSSTTGIGVGMAVTGNANLGVSTKVATVNAGNVILTVVNAGNVTGNVTFYDAGTGAAPGTVSLTNAKDSAFLISAYVPGGSAKTGDIVKQESARRFRCTTADGTAVLCLTANASVASGEVRISCKDSNSNTYYVNKISGRTATLTRASGGSNYDWTSGQKVPWSLLAATAPTDTNPHVQAVVTP